jgi:hypothetical protein
MSAPYVVAPGGGRTRRRIPRYPVPVFDPAARVLVFTLCAAAAGSCGTGQPSVGSQEGEQTGSGQVSTARPDSAGGATGNAQDSATAGRVPSTCEDLHYQILEVPATREAFAAAFGQPDSVAASTEPNRHIAGAVDSLFTVHYPGAHLEIRTPPGGRDMATHVRVTDNRYLAYPGIGPGTAAARVEEVLGEPRERAGGYLRYQCGEGAEQPVTFRIAAGRVSAVEIDYYVD